MAPRGGDREEEVAQQRPPFPPPSCTGRPSYALKCLPTPRAHTPLQASCCAPHLTWGDPRWGSTRGPRGPGVAGSWGCLPLRSSRAAKSFCVPAPGTEVARADSQTTQAWGRRDPQEIPSQSRKGGWPAPGQPARQWLVGWPGMNEFSCSACLGLSQSTPPFSVLPPPRPGILPGPAWSRPVPGSPFPPLSFLGKVSVGLCWEA